MRIDNLIIMSLGKLSNPKLPAGYGTVANLVKASKNKKRDVERVAVRTEHVHFRKQSSRNPYRVTNIDDTREIDLADLSSRSKYDKYKYVLNVIDIFSRYVWSVPLKDKTGTSITTALKLYFKIENKLT